ncbi:hypothetical protein G6O67_005619 [Ophiocordyceps sinensis]|uniref:Uncharacterized protein n=1 Tax=Ophiocordyceps sinensis TaxID=72228 RepID=A0A8H4PP99_9HYPO|nr:hypothetical protein G6O67_005619 [Ophiocordyceps sinensis]
MANRRRPHHKHTMKFCYNSSPPSSPPLGGPQTQGDHPIPTSNNLPQCASISTYRHGQHHCHHHHHYLHHPLRPQATTPPSTTSSPGWRATPGLPIISHGHFPPRPDNTGPAGPREGARCGLSPGEGWLNLEMGTTEWAIAAAVAIFAIDRITTMAIKEGMTVAIEEGSSTHIMANNYYTIFRLTFNDPTASPAPAPARRPGSSRQAPSSSNHPQDKVRLNIYIPAWLVPLPPGHRPPLHNLFAPGADHAGLPDLDKMAYHTMFKITYHTPPAQPAPAQEPHTLHNFFAPGADHAGPPEDLGVGHAARQNDEGVADPREGARRGPPRGVGGGVGVGAHSQ